MSIKVGDRFDGFVVTITMRSLIARWSAYRSCIALAKITTDVFEKNVLDACLEDEYQEMVNDPEIMGVGLYLYNATQRAN